MLDCKEKRGDDEETDKYPFPSGYRFHTAIWLVLMIMVHKSLLLFDASLTGKIGDSSRPNTEQPVRLNVAGAATAANNLRI